MIQIGYEPKGENGIPNRQYFQKGGDDRTHHLHIYVFGNSKIESHFIFRDYLRTHPKEAKEYGELKEALALRFPLDNQSYQMLLQIELHCQLC
jgi:GrpB-like predicted nucleotidyltransferase (UPF0157 family)